MRSRDGCTAGAIILRLTQLLRGWKRCEEKHRAGLKIEKVERRKKRQRRRGERRKKKDERTVIVWHQSDRNSLLISTCSLPPHPQSPPSCTLSVSNRPLPRNTFRLVSFHRRLKNYSLENSLALVPAKLFPGRRKYFQFLFRAWNVATNIHNSPVNFIKFY